MSNMDANISQHIADLARDAKAWPYAEARALQARLEKMDHSGDVIFETGYGPSGLPHIGTFGEVVRTTMVRRAFEHLTGASTRLICFSDDMDGLRKIPDNVPTDSGIEEDLGKPLTSVRDPFGEYPSFGAHNNARLNAFLDSFGFDYEFMSSTERYRSGEFDDGMRTVLANYSTVMDIILPTLGPERRRNYSPFFPICPDTGVVLQAEVVMVDAPGETIAYRHPVTDKKMETKVTGGACKLQWKVDWATRWNVLGIDYEMAGKDLIESVRLSTRIQSAFGGIPPCGISYELFLDVNGEKISKSRGNGLTIEEWLACASPESLSHFMYGQPKRAKRLHFEIIPRTVDEYYQHLAAAQTQEPSALVENPLWHVHGKRPDPVDLPVSYTLLLNLASVCHAETPEVVWRHLGEYIPGASPKTHPELDRLIGYAVSYYLEKVRPNEKYRAPTKAEAGHLEALAKAIAALRAEGAAGHPAERPEGVEAEDVQSAVYAVGKEAGYESLRDWFGCLYEVLLGQKSGPRMGSFFALYGLERSIALINDAIEGRLVGGAGKAREEKGSGTDKATGGAGASPNAGERRA